jgi:hypothetical protein
MSIRPPRATERRRTLRALATASFVLTVLATPSAEAQSGPTSIAEQLFLEGKALMQEKQYEKACEKLKASYALDLSAYGTLLNLALCHEATNKVATAWAEFRVVAAASEGRRGDRVALAREHEAKLFPRLSYLKISVPQAARMSGLAIRVDGTSLEEAVWDTDVSVDPGQHVVEVSAPGKIARRSTVTIGASSDHQAIAVDPLEDAPAPARTGDADSSRNTRTTIGYAVGGTGLAAIGAGLVFGLIASNRRDDARQLCATDGVCPSQAAKDEASELYSSAKTSANVSTAFVGAGVLLVVSGVVLVLTGRPAPSKVQAASSFTVAPLASGGAALWQGQF